MKKKDDDMLLSFDNLRNHVGDRKAKKFFRITIPILVIEIVAALALGIYLIVVPRNYCEISINVPNAVIYVNNEETDKFRLEKPESKSQLYSYAVDISVLLPGEGMYNVEFVVKCDKYDNTYATTSAEKIDNVYKLQVEAGKKTKILSAVTIRDSSKINNFKVNIKINAKKVTN